MMGELTNFLSQPEDISITQDIDTELRQAAKATRKHSVYIIEGVDDPADPLFVDDGHETYKFSDISQNADGRYVAKEMKIL